MTVRCSKLDTVAKIKFIITSCKGDIFYYFVGQGRAYKTVESLSTLVHKPKYGGHKTALHF